MPVVKGQKYNIEPKLRIKKVFDKVVVSGSTMKKAMIDEGYSPNTAVAPTKLTKTKSWQQLLQKHVPDSKLASVLKEGLDAKVDGGEVPDHVVRHRYLETGLKLKSKFPKEEPDDTVKGDIKLLIIQVNNVINNTKS